MKAKIKFYLPNNLLQKQHPVEGRQEFEGEVESVCPSLFQDAVGSLGGGVYQVDVRDIPDHGITPKDNQIKELWKSVDLALRTMGESTAWSGDEEDSETAETAMEALDELREIYK